MLVIDDRVGNWFVHNGTMCESTPETSLELDFDGPVIYEVIRYINGRGLFKKDHMIRLQRSSEAEGISLPITEAAYDRYVLELLERTGQSNCNIKLLACEGQYVIYLSRTFYPEPEVYKTGVSTASIQIERPDPNAKVRRESYIEEIGSFRKEHQVFEALLLNRENQYTEGSRSNLFFIPKGESCLYTAPSEMILEGVMRRHLLELCDELGVPVVQTPISREGLSQVEAAFLTGTSIKVLPIAKIDGVLYNSPEHPLVQKLMRRFDEYVERGV